MRVVSAVTPPGTRRHVGAADRYSDKVTGKFTYMHDFSVPGMLHGRVVRPPAIGAQLLSVDEASIQGMPGAVRIVRQGNFLGVVAGNEWAAIKGSRQLKATWSAWEGLPDQATVFDHVELRSLFERFIEETAHGR